MTIFNLVRLKGLVLTVTISSISSSSNDKCMFCGENVVSRIIKTRLNGILVDSYLTCIECSTRVIAPAFEVQGFEVSWAIADKEENR